MNKLQTIKKLKKSNKCAYPGCSEKSLAMIMLPIGELTESNQIIFPQESSGQSVQSSCNLCAYHMIFAEKGIINLVKINGLIQLFAPLPIIDVVEAVLYAKEFNKTFKKAIKKKNNKKKTIKNAKSK